MRRAPAGKTARETGKNNPEISLANPPSLGGDWMLVADFHTHPVTNWPLRNASDDGKASNNNIPGIVKGDGVATNGPPRAGARPDNAYRPDAGYPGNKLDTRNCK